MSSGGSYFYARFALVKFTAKAPPQRTALYLYIYIYIYPPTPCVKGGRVSSSKLLWTGSITSGLARAGAAGGFCCCVRCKPDFGDAGDTVGRSEFCTKGPKVTLDTLGLHVSSEPVCVWALLRRGLFWRLRGSRASRLAGDAGDVAAVPQIIQKSCVSNSFPCLCPFDEPVACRDAAVSGFSSI